MEKKGKKKGCSDSSSTSGHQLLCDEGPVSSFKERISSWYGTRKEVLWRKSTGKEIGIFFYNNCLGFPLHVPHVLKQGLDFFFYLLHWFLFKWEVQMFAKLGY